MMGHRVDRKRIPQTMVFPNKSIVAYTTSPPSKVRQGPFCCSITNLHLASGTHHALCLAFAATPPPCLQTTCSARSSQRGLQGPCICPVLCGKLSAMSPVVSSVLACGDADSLVVAAVCCCSQVGIFNKCLISCAHLHRMCWKLKHISFLSKHYVVLGISI